LHGAHTLDLFDRQGKKQGAHDHREDDYAQSSWRIQRVEELKGIAHHARERGKHSPKEIRYNRYKIHKILLILPNRFLP
jgi:hypothetical protein